MCSLWTKCVLSMPGKVDKESTLQIHYNQLIINDLTLFNKYLVLSRESEYGGFLFTEGSINKFNLGRKPLWGAWLGVILYGFVLSSTSLLTPALFHIKKSSVWTESSYNGHPYWEWLVVGNSLAGLENFAQSCLLGFDWIWGPFPFMKDLCLFAQVALSG